MFCLSVNINNRDNTEKNRFQRTALLLGDEACDKIKNSKVIIFGVGGVGGYAAEALARSGVGSISLVDRDTVSITNINRQIIALSSTVGRYKTEVMKERILDINPEACVTVHNCFYMPENSGSFDFSEYDYVIDAVDTVTAKLEIIMRAKECGVPVISSMGAGNKLDPARFAVADIYKTSVCPLARVMRSELRKRGVKKLKVVYSTEEARRPAGASNPDEHGKISPGSIAFVPSVAGLILASEVIKDLSGIT